MKLSNIKLSILILTSLIVLSYAFLSYAEDQANTSNNIFLDSDQDGLSDQEEIALGTDPHNSDTDSDGYSDGAEVKSGYNPLKPAPGDKIIQSAAPQQAANETADPDEKNLTKYVAQKISKITTSSDQEEQTLTVDEIKSLVDDSLNKNIPVDQLPQIDPKEIKIKKQNYKGTADEIKAKKKEDFANYVIAVYYILSSNSPDPITSESSLGGIADSITKRIISAITAQDPDALSDLNTAGQKILEQMKDIEVPEELTDTHIKGLQFANYAFSIESAISPNSEDPLADIANLSKIQGLVETLINFSSEVQSKFSEYGLQYDDMTKGKIEKLGIDLPVIDDLNNIQNEQ